MAGYVQAAAAIYGAISSRNSGNKNSASMGMQADAIEQQTAQSEATLRQQNQIALADQAAAMGEAGVAGSSSSEAVQRQSAVNAEMDALNLRYKGMLQAFGVRRGKSIASSDNNAATNSGYLSAGAEFLKARAKYS